MAHQWKTQRPLTLDSDEEVPQDGGKFKNSNETLKKTSVKSQGKDFYEVCSQTVAEDLTEAKYDLINDSNETERIQATQCEDTREKDHEKVIKTQ